MDCPYCAKADTEVIDSRPTKEGIAIRRRRQCLACSRRFTTYECTEGSLLLLLINRGAGPQATIMNLRTVLKSISEAFKALTRETGELIKKVDKLEKAESGKRSRTKAVVKGPVKKKAAMKQHRPRKPITLTSTASVLKIIGRHKRGADIAKLKARTGFDDAKIRNIVYRACKEGKIKRVDRGVYIQA